MASVNFKAKIQLRGINPYVLVSRSQATRIKADWRKPLPVVVRINGQPTKPWHTNMMPTGDNSFYLYLHGAARSASNTKVGDIVLIEVRFDNDYREGPHALPNWFNEALAKQPRARSNWEKLSPSRQKEIVRYFANLKSAAAKASNLERAMRALSGTEERFMGRSWRDGS